jgi:chromosome segregation ATPase
VTAQQEADGKQAADLAALATETRAVSQSISERLEAICRDLGLQQEDLAAAKSAIASVSSRMDALVERLDRQADTVRKMCTAYSQRESELEQLVDGLARLRAFPTPLAANAL